MNLPLKILDGILCVIAFIVALFMVPAAVMYAGIGIWRVSEEFGDYQYLFLVALYPLAAWQFHRKKWIK